MDCHWSGRRGGCRLGWQVRLCSPSGEEYIELRLQDTVDLPYGDSRGQLEKEVGRQPRDAALETAGSEDCTLSMGSNPRYGRKQA
jgi:hypothetical protein